MKKFEIPEHYKSPIISEIKLKRKTQDKMKKDFSPTLLDFGPVHFIVARHFGFCYGVENAIETIYTTIAQNRDKRIFLLSEMIHNAKVNQDLLDMGVVFLMDTQGHRLVDFETLTNQDIVVIPAFGTTLELEKEFKERGIELKAYDTTCPFVEKVWKRSEKLGKENFTVVIHGKPTHEETRATFSHSTAYAASIVVNDLEETKLLAQYIRGQKPLATFFNDFQGRTSPNFNPEIHLKKIGVVNQTTMLATDTQEIADYLKHTLEAMDESHESADTRDTLCYATSDNQNAVYGMLEHSADLALVVGGYNSSNTSHLVELCDERLNTFHLDSVDRILSKTQVSHLEYHSKKEQVTQFLPQKEVVKILITSGASCPDSIVDEIMTKILSYYPTAKSTQEVLSGL